MDQITDIWNRLPESVLGTLSGAQALPYPALHVLGALLVLALLARSLSAILMTGLLVWVAGSVLQAHPSDELGWRVLWIVGFVSVIGTLVAFHRHRLARRVSIQREQLNGLKEELADLRPKYEREVAWRMAGVERPDGAGREEPARRPAPVASASLV